MNQNPAMVESMLLQAIYTFLNVLCQVRLFLFSGIETRGCFLRDWITSGKNIDLCT